MIFNNKKKDDMISYESYNRRGSFRIDLSDAEPVLARIKDKEVKLINIGALGVSFNNLGLKKGETFSTHFNLPRLNIQIDVVLEIIKIDKNICRCKFIEISDDSIESIHKYMLLIQKESIKKK